MASESNEVIQRLFQRFFRDELPGLSPADRAAFESEFEGRYGELLDRSSSSTTTSFADLVGFGDGPVKPFDALQMPLLRNDFDESIIPPQNIQLKKNGGASSLRIFYDRRVPFIYNVDLLVHFDTTVDLSKGGTY